MNTLGLQFKNMVSSLNLAQNLNNSPIQETNKPRFSISVKEMQTISNALIVYSKHLQKKQNGTKAEQTLALEERIFDYLQNVA